MLDHFDLIASIYDRLIGPPDTGRLRQLLQLPTTGWMLDRLTILATFGLGLVLRGLARDVLV